MLSILHTPSSLPRPSPTAVFTCIPSSSLFLPPPSLPHPVSTQDDDPYVRKTAAICVAKLFDINAELVEERGFLDTLKDLISDSNPMVVANAVAALAEIQESSSRPVFEITTATLFKLLAALNECTE